MTKNRSRQEIIRDILSLLEVSPLSKTKVMYRASLSYTQLKSYGSYLMDNYLIRLENEQWVLTDKGKGYLDICKLGDKILSNGLENEVVAVADPR